MGPLPVLRVLLVVVFCMASLAQGQSPTIADLLSVTPQCALPCFFDAVAGAACSLTDVGVLSECLCTNHTLLTELTGCVRLSCETTDQVQAQNLLGQLCPSGLFPRESRQVVLIVVAISAIVLAMPSTSLRWLARCKSSRLGWDDYTALFVAVMLVALSALQLKSVALGLGLHVWNVDPSDAISLLQYYWVSQQIYTLSQLVFQISTLALYARVFPARWFQRTVIAAIVTFVVQDTIFLGLVTVRCLPIQATWDIRIEGRCLDLNHIGLAGAILHIIEHFLILALPVPELWKLKLSKRKKMQLLMVFGIASLSCIASVVRINYVTSYQPTADLSWDTAPVVAWSIIEDLSAIVCINLPPCRHLLSKLFPRRLRGTTTLGKYPGSTTLQYGKTTSTTMQYEKSYMEASEKDVFAAAALQGTVTTTISSGPTESHKSKTRVSWLSSVHSLVPSSPRRERTLDVDIDQSELGLGNLGLS